MAATSQAAGTAPAIAFIPNPARVSLAAMGNPMAVFSTVPFPHVFGLPDAVGLVWPRAIAQRIDISPGCSCAVVDVPVWPGTVLTADAPRDHEIAQDQQK